LAAAGLDRLGFGDRISQRLSTEEMLPAIGQGALAIETRAEDERVRTLCGALIHEETTAAVAAERGLLFGLGVGCRTPVAGHAVVESGQIWLRGFVGRPDATRIIRAEGRGAIADAAALGADMATRLLKDGGAEILAEFGA